VSWEGVSVKDDLDEINYGEIYKISTFIYLKE
jgi:hypothetical protein